MKTDRPGLGAALAELASGPVAIAAHRLGAVLAGAFGGPRGPAPTTGDAIAIVQVVGFLAPRESFSSRVFGGASLDKVREQIRALAGSSAVGTIVLVIDSPGGSVYGCEETAAVVADAAKKKRVIAVADGLCASAAFWIACAASELVVSPSGEVGSIGVYMLHFDWSENLSKGGIVPTIIRHGENKAEGNPYQPLADGARDHLASLCADYGRAFERQVARGRGVGSAYVKAHFGQGRTFTAQRALDVGMVDRVATLDDVLGELRSGKYKPARKATAAVATSTTSWSDQVDRLDARQLDWLRRIAVHEAAHAVGFAIEGVGVKRVELEILADLAASQPRDFVEGVTSPRRAGAPAWVFAAGVVGEQVMGFAAEWDTGGSDWAQAGRRGGLAGWGAPERTAARVAHRLLESEQPAIGAVANALLERGRLSGDEAERIIANAWGPRDWRASRLGLEAVRA